MGFVPLRPLAHDYTLTPTMMNHVTAAYNRQLNPSTSKHVRENGAAALGLKGIADFNYPQIGGLTGDRVSFPTLGYTANDLGGATAYQFVDTFSWIRGKHSFKFGFDYRWNGLNWRDGQRTRFGPISARTSPDFPASPRPDTASRACCSAKSLAPAFRPKSVGSQFPMYSGFFQDDWRAAGG